jgi:hypothetical protein
MASIDENSLLNVSYGIMMPFTKHRFILDKITVLDDEQNHLVRHNLNVLYFDFNIDSLVGGGYDAFGNPIKHSHSLLLNIEEPANGRLVSVLETLRNAEDKFDIVVHNTEGDMVRCKETIYKGCRLKSYKYRLDYSASETCNYPLWFSVEQVHEKVLKEPKTTTL